MPIRSAIHFALIVALSVSAGVHLAALQSLAWTGMVLEFAQQEPLALAIEKTFDGENPCGLCKAVVSGSRSEEDKAPATDGSTAEVKFLLQPAAELATPSAHDQRFWVRTPGGPLHLSVPLLQPPRIA